MKNQGYFWLVVSCWTYIHTLHTNSTNRCALDYTESACLRQVLVSPLQGCFCACVHPPHGIVNADEWERSHKCTHKHTHTHGIFSGTLPCLLIKHSHTYIVIECALHDSELTTFHPLLLSRCSRLITITYCTFLLVISVLAQCIHITAPLHNNMLMSFIVQRYIALLVSFKWNWILHFVFNQECRDTLTCRSNHFTAVEK